MSKVTEECKKEIEEYLRKEGYINTISLFRGGGFGSDEYIDPQYLYHSSKGRDRKLLSKWCREYHSVLDKYLLEFIGKILRKHNVTKIFIHHSYESKDWKLENIKRINNK